MNYSLKHNIKNQNRYHRLYYGDIVFSNCVGSLEYLRKRSEMKFVLSWCTQDDHAKGVNEYSSIDALIEDLYDFSFISLKSDPDIILKIYAAGFEGEFRILN